PEGLAHRVAGHPELGHQGFLGHARPRRVTALSDQVAEVLAHCARCRPAHADILSHIPNCSTGLDRLFNNRYLRSATGLDPYAYGRTTMSEHSAADTPETTGSRSLTPTGRGTLLGAIFLMATSSIGPGFITQTTTFTVELGAAFAFAILISILVDIAIQTNVWRVIGVTGM